MTTPTNTLDKGKVQLGFIGLGLMGSRLTDRLHSAGWNVQAWNRSPRPADVGRRPIQDGGDTSGVCRQIPKDKER